MSTFLDTILKDAADELAAAKVRRSAADLRGMIADAPPPRDFASAISRPFGLIAEIKQRSPSVGPMLEANVNEAPSAYEDSPVVRAISVLTNLLHFGQTIEVLQDVRCSVSKPVIRKDFIADEYQVREARAFGADAILLMANVLDRSRLAGFHDLACELGMEALFEVHTADEIQSLPSRARVVGINSRKFKSDTGFVGSKGRSEKDFSLTFDAFGLADRLPAGAIRVAESGLTAETLPSVRESFHAALIGTSLLRHPEGIREGLKEFEKVLLPGEVHGA